MIKQPFFSICIPTYNSVVFLVKLLDSMEKQCFQDFEIIISDDSTDDNIKEYVEKNKNSFKKIRYYKRERDGNATNNWNNALILAKGQYKMLLHHDDYFFDNSTLENIYKEIIRNNNPSLLFLSFKEESDKHKFYYGKYNFKNLLFNPNQLLYVNFLSTPSCLILSKNITDLYDNKLKWLVDVDFYIKLINKYSNIINLKSVKVVIGGDDTRITKTITQKDILFEYHYLTQKKVFKTKIGIYYIILKKALIVAKHLIIH